MKKKKGEMDLPAANARPSSTTSILAKSVTAAITATLCGFLLCRFTLKDNFVKCDLKA